MDGFRLKICSHQKFIFVWVHSLDDDEDYYLEWASTSTCYAVFKQKSIKATMQSSQEKCGTFFWGGKCSKIQPFQNKEALYELPILQERHRTVRL